MNVKEVNMNEIHSEKTEMLSATNIYENQILTRSTSNQAALNCPKTQKQKVNRASNPFASNLLVWRWAGLSTNQSMGRS